MDNRINRALEFATKAHGDQRRKYTGELYINHPIEVAKLVADVPGATTEMVMAALLHDVIEDTPVTRSEIESEFGQDVAELVWWLSDQSKPMDGNRAVRKEIDLQHIAKAPAQAKTIKLADLVSNTRSISKYDPDFWRVYRHEKLRMLEVLREGDKELWDLAMSQCAPEAVE